MKCALPLAGAALAAASAPPYQPSWPSPSPRFPSSWFGANVRSFEFEDPKQVAILQNFTQIFASWPEKVVTTRFSNSTAVAVEDATRMKAMFPHAAVFTYQSMWVAAGYYDEAWALMQDLDRYGGFFVPPHVATYTSYCRQVQENLHLDPPVNASTYPRCVGYYWNWCNATAIDYWLNHVMLPMVADPTGKPYDFDGIFLDNSDAFRPPGGSGISCDITAARLNVHIALGKFLHKYNKWPVFSFTPKQDEVNAIWDGGVGFSKFYEYFTPTNAMMTSLYEDTKHGLPTVVHVPTVYHNAELPLNDALAAFLVATGGAPHTYFQYSPADWVEDSSWQYYPQYGVKYGTATGTPTWKYYDGEKSVIWTREFSSGATVSVNCNSTKGGMCTGSVTGV